MARPLNSIKKIYLHWTATGYDWKEPGHYHTVITGNGKIHRLTDYTQDLNAHTFARNSNSVGFSISCMAGKAGQEFDTTPPTEKQLQAMCEEVARLAKKIGWNADDIDITTVMTHAEAAANRDFPLQLAKKVSGLHPASTPAQNAADAQANALGMPHYNYGPSTWHDGWPGGDVFRWDLWKLKKSDIGGTGGFTLRGRIRKLMENDAADQIVVSINGLEAKGILHEGKSFAPLSALSKVPGWAVTVEGTTVKIVVDEVAHTLPVTKVANNSLVAFRALSDELGMELNWNPIKRLVTLKDVD